jgi:hypothetical protein
LRGMRRMPVTASGLWLLCSFDSILLLLWLHPSRLSLALFRQAYREFCHK